MDGQADFRSDDATIVRAFVVQSLRNGTLTLAKPLVAPPHLPTYVAPALIEIGLAETAAASIWQQFTRDANLKASPSGRCRSEVRRKARFLLWLREQFRAPGQKPVLASTQVGRRSLAQAV
ncbi:hypothetical protein RAS12_30315 (plasmid) [Achromobacter seleniivolatilans]|uniref:Uncharacterized protein n=1 Tax=Achromobacter seleniivolatilans TaxID=3047478 RepID=A0ABY9MBF6_9BURK|nr:hypothetical protein [Achromobacter sp. R39]WMD23929.1 hypothetical protein RAS12_30315 [Achromobacter sp. R39]